MGNIVDVSLAGGGLLDDVEVTYIPINETSENQQFWEFVKPSTGDIAITGTPIVIVKKLLNQP